MQNIDFDILNLSLGLTSVSDDAELHKICEEYRKNNKIIISAFDNNGALSYPASYSDVIGVTSEYFCNNVAEYYTVDDDRVNICANGLRQRVMWKDGTFIFSSGNSYACAHFTGIFSLFFDPFSNVSLQEQIVKHSFGNLSIDHNPNRNPKDSPVSGYKRAVLFPFNKEMHSLIRFEDINRLDFGKKYCHNSPTIEESVLQRAVMTAIMKTAQQNIGVLQTLKTHIGMGLETEKTEDNSMEIQIRIAEIDAEFKAMLSKISTETVDAFDEEKAKRLMDEKVKLQQQLGEIQDVQLRRKTTQSRLDDIYTILDGLKNRPMEYDEQIVRQLLECITVDSKEQITVIFVGGLKVMQPLIG